MVAKKKVTQYTYDVNEPAMPETGHTMLLPSEQKNEAIDMDPRQDPELQWSGKVRRKTIPILPLQRNEIITDSRIRQIIDRATKAALDKSGQMPLTHFFELEKALRDQDRTKRVEFYMHEEKWKNKLICGDSLLLMQSLMYYEGLRGKAQMIYIDPPYGIKYNSNFQQRVDSTSNDEKDRADDVLTIKAFNDTWVLGVHSYLSYLQERLYLCRELLHESGSVFVQISDRNVHLVRTLLDEVFGSRNFISMISFVRAGAQTTEILPSVSDYLLWYAKDKSLLKFKRLYVRDGGWAARALDIWIEYADGRRERWKKEGKPPPGARLFTHRVLESASGGESSQFPITLPDESGVSRTFYPVKGWSTNPEGVQRLIAAKRLMVAGKAVRFIVYLDDFPFSMLTSNWRDTGTGQFTESKVYVVQTGEKVASRCILMATDPADLVLDPTCGGGTTAYCAEKLGRRWITCDTSRVAINITRKRLLSAVFKHYRTRNGQVSSGFVYRRVPQVGLKSTARGLEPAQIELVDEPEIEEDALRVTGPFEVMTVGRYSAEDWKGYVNDSGKLENYIEVICRLYRKDAAIQSATGLIHAVAETEASKIALSVGPMLGRVTAKQISDAVEDGIALGINEIHVMGWAFEANVGEVKSKLESRGKIKIHLITIRPDTLVDGLKAAPPELLFSPYAVPDIEIRRRNDSATVLLKGVAVFDRKTRSTDYKRADSGYISAWYLDEDYDGDCFVDCQMFFVFPLKLKLDKLVGIKIAAEELRLQLSSSSFPVRGYKRIAVKVVDVFGNESTVVKDIA